MCVTAVADLTDYKPETLTGDGPAEVAAVAREEGTNNGEFAVSEHRDAFVTTDGCEEVVALGGVLFTTHSRKIVTPKRWVVVIEQIGAVVRSYGGVVVRSDRGRYTGPHMGVTVMAHRGVGVRSHRGGPTMPRGVGNVMSHGGLVVRTHGGVEVTSRRGVPVVAHGRVIVRSHALHGICSSWHTGGRRSGQTGVVRRCHAREGPS